MTERKLVVRVRRQDGPTASPRTERFSVSSWPGMTVADVLHAIDDDLRLDDGQPTTPIAWASGCTWPSCGVCTMAIQGRAAPACGTRVQDLGQRVTSLSLAPMSAFPVLRDLYVDRSRMRTDVRRAEAHTRTAQRISDPVVAAFGRCTQCGACLDACPETHPKAAFVGPYALGALHAAKLGRGEALPLRLLDRGGIADCGHVQNCLDACPEGIPLNDAVAAAASQGLSRWMGAWFGRSKKP